MKRCMGSAIYATDSGAASRILVLGGASYGRNSEANCKRKYAISVQNAHRRITRPTRPSKINNACSDDLMASPKKNKSNTLIRFVDRNLGDRIRVKLQ